MPPLYSDFLNVRSFGARGDGTTDDTAALQAAIAVALASTPVKPIFVPAGTYIVGTLMTAALSASQAFAMFGESRTASILKLKASTNGPILNLYPTNYTPPSPYTSINFVCIHDLGFDGNGANQAMKGTGGYVTCGLLSIRNCYFGEFRSLYFANGVSRGIEEIASADDSAQPGGTHSSYNQYSNILIRESVKSGDIPKSDSAIHIENGKFNVMSNIVIHRWGGGLTIYDSGELVDESGGFHNITGITVVESHEDGVRIAGSTWISLTGYCAMWVAHYGTDGDPGGYPLHFTEGLAPNTASSRTNVGQCVVSNFIFRANGRTNDDLEENSDNIVFDKADEFNQCVLANGYIVNGKRGIVARGLRETIFSNILVNNLRENAISILNSDSTNDPQPSTNMLWNGMYVIGYKGGIEIDGNTTNVHAPSIFLYPNIGDGFTQIETGSSTGGCRFGICGVHKYNGSGNEHDDPNTAQIALGATSNRVYFDGDILDCKQRVEVESEPIVRVRLGAIPDLTSTNALADTRNRVNDILEAMRYLDGDGHGLIED